MSIQTYAELETAVGNWLARSNLTERIPEFISIGESRINREVRSRLQEQRSTTTSAEYVNVPTDFLEMRSIWVTASGARRALSYLEPSMLFQQFPYTSESGAPTHFTIIGDELRLAPATAGYTVEMWYFKRLAALSGTLNSVFTSNPDLYLYAALTAAIPFLKDDKRVMLWEAEYKAVRDQLNGSEREGRYAPGMAMTLA